MIDKATLWTVIPAMAVGTYLMRWSFLGALGNRPLPAWLARALRYTAVGVLPALVAPAVLWPAATGGQPDAARILAALTTLAAGLATKSMMAALVAGAAMLYGMLWLLG